MEQRLDEISKGCRQINFGRHGAVALDAACDAAGRYLDNLGKTDLATFSVDEWRGLVWNALAAGVVNLQNTTDQEYRAALNAIDQIPF
jgi:hypothetical protein